MLEQATKPCIKCGETKPLLKFPSVKQGRYRGATCNACRHAARPPDPKGLARCRRWKAANRERHLELKKAQSKRFRQRAAHKAGRFYKTQEEHKAFFAAMRLERHAARASRAAETQATARQARAKRIVEKPWSDPTLSSAERWSLRYKLDADFNLRERLRTALRHQQDGVRIGELMRETIVRGGRSRSIERRLGFTIADLITHLERQFTKGMSWAAFLRGDIHIDHRVPLSSFNLDSEADLRAAWALTNLQPMWARENISKGARRVLLV